VKPGAASRKFLVTLHLSDSQLALIGDITARWSVVEWMLIRIMEALLLTGPKEARILATGMGAVEKIKVVRLLAYQRLHDVKARAALLAALENVDAARVGRNDIAHGIWTVDKEQGQLHLMKYRGGREDINRIKGDARPMTTRDLQERRRSLALPARPGDQVPSSTSCCLLSS
jgi:hypothetical protein